MNSLAKGLLAGAAGWGAVRGVLGAIGLPPLAATALHFAAVWGSEQIDAFHHAVYASATGAAYSALAQ